MMAAMMLPSAAPAVLLFNRTARRPLMTTGFVAGYLGVWIAYGLFAYAVYRLIGSVDPGFLAWDRAGPWIAGGAVIAAGLYQLTPLKRLCLRHCRSPLHFLLARWRPGRSGALRMGAEHGAYCAGCCWALMLVLFAVGIMSIFWMLVVTAIVFAEKVLPGGERTSLALAVGLAALGIWIGVSPGTVPGLTIPGGASSGAMPAHGGSAMEMP
jgi:predicted metal-binding membrane protein